MTLAVMTRATLGHTGRPLHVGIGTTLVYLMVSVAAVARIATAAWGGGYDVLLWTAAITWIGAFSGYLVLYGPMLVRPRPTAKPAECDIAAGNEAVKGINMGEKVERGRRR